MYAGFFCTVYFYRIKITGDCMHTVNGAMLHHVESVEAITEILTLTMSFAWERLSN